MEQLCGSRDCRRERAGGRRACRAEQGLELCRFCCARVRDDLGELPKLYEEFESSLTRFPFAFEERVSGGEMKGLCLNEASVDARREIISVLATWSGMVAEERRLAASPRRDVPDLAAFLTRHLDWLLAHPAGRLRWGVPEATIRKWASRGKISRYGRPGRAEYDLGELIEIAAARHDRRSTGN
jgi:hypothetical protein